MGDDFDKQEVCAEATITKEVVGIIIVSHVDLGSALFRAMEFILGPQYDCCAVSINTSHDVSETVQRLEDAANRLDQGAGVLILTDMFGGNPTNIALSLLGKHNLEVVTGVNLPMLLKVFGARNLPLDELAETARKAGQGGIVVTGKMLSKSKKKEMTL
ncbi:MAG: PTS sugar transporter subunit IIA [Desulfovibrionaceae bacterium]|nr:PTS sugar transporter subunit IIA [Desulfovibrionaceae bacterium]